ncbi:MAG: TlpA family protein disulfide reductase, partial [Kangiellaceae bacterium]|nr:TlpA family protein disulfide reductase [Kangiellaceae bacterium]
SSLDDFRGKWVVVNFWAEWCSPCIEEIPELNRLAAESDELNIVVLGVSYDPIENDALSGLVRKLNIEYPVMATDPAPILPFTLPPTLPTNYLLTPDGEVIAKLVGTQNYESLVLALTKAKQAVADEG